MTALNDYVRNKILQGYIDARRAGKGRLYELTVKGWFDIERKVQHLERFEQNRAVKAGLRSGGNYLKTRRRQRLRERNYRKVAKGRTRKGMYLSSNLYNSFQVRLKRHSLGALVGFTKTGHHAHLVDLGTAERHTKKEHPRFGTYRGRMPASKFWSDTAEEDWRGAMDRVMAAIDRAITRIMLRRD